MALIYEKKISQEIRSKRPIHPYRIFGYFLCSILFVSRKIRRFSIYVGFIAANLGFNNSLRVLIAWPQLLIARPSSLFDADVLLFTLVPHKSCLKLVNNQYLSTSRILNLPDRHFKRTPEGNRTPSNAPQSPKSTRKCKQKSYPSTALPP